MELAAQTGGGLLYMTNNSPLLSPGEATGVADVYRAQRSAGGWETARRLSPPGPGAVAPRPGGVSADQAYAFTQVEPLGGGHPGGSLAVEIYNTYLGKPDGTFEPIGIGNLGTERQAQGRYISDGGTHVVFSTGNLQGQSFWCETSLTVCPVRKLEPDAAPTGTGTVYDRAADGPTHVISLLPGDEPQTASQQAFYMGTSKEANSVAFKIGGVLYVRVKNGLPSEETEEVAAGNPVYAGLSKEGRYLFYVEGGEEGTIHRFDTTDESDEEVNPTAEGEVVNVSADGSHVYFISEEQIGGQGTAGQPNLFVWSAGATTFIGTVAASDLEGSPALTNWTSYAVAPTVFDDRGPGAEASRSTPDGKFLVFESRAELTGYENGGHTEIYRWDDEEEALTCVSCNPLAKPAVGDARLQEVVLVPFPIIVNNLSEDGSRVFFETPEALVSRDSDGVNDIYEWQREGIGSRVDLISSGQSFDYRSPLAETPGKRPAPNLLLAATPSGDDVFYRAQEALVPGAGAGGSAAIYDARVGGGFPVLSVPSPCLEEGCKPAPSGSSTSLNVPQSETTSGASNVKPKRRCHRPEQKRHAKQKHCSGKKAKKKKEKAHGHISAVPQTQAPELATVTEIQEPAKPESSLDPPPPQAPSAANGPITAAGGEFSQFKIESFGAEESSTAAGLHPDFNTSFSLYQFINFKTGKPESDARAEEISVSLPPGLLGNPNAITRCSTGQLMASANCPIDSQVGIAKAVVVSFGKLTTPVYNLTPPHPDREVARFGFWAGIYPVFIDVHVRTASDYGATATVHSSPGLAALLSAETVLWGNPSDPSHDKLRLTAKESNNCNTACEAPGGKRVVPRTGLAFMSNPSACQENQIGLEVKSYQLPGQVFSKSAALPPTTDCEGLPFAPSFEANPTSHVAGAPTGLNTKLTIPQHLGAEEKATSTMREARVTLPAGMQVAAGAANWIGTCSDQQVGFHEEVDAACPDSSKLGTASITSPAISAPIEGNVYQRAPMPGHQLGLWLVSDALGLHIKIPGELEPDPNTGRLVAVFRDLPQVPASEIDLNVWGGPRAPLQNPDHCGTYTTNYTFSPHSDDPAATGSSTMQITEGCNQPFDPKLGAGVTDPTAAKYSPLIVDLTRQDGDQALRGFELELPDGQLAKLKGVPLCPDAAAQSGSCPADSALGHVVASSGPGPEPLWVPQPGKPEPKVYLAGPYEGFPFSVVTEVPAQAGPFDLGTLAVRSGLGLNPDTNRPLVKADPLPQFFEGVGLTYRRVHVVVDRPEFALNGTDCREGQVDSTMTSTLGTVAHPAARFQLEGCKALKFKPKLQIELRGGTKRADYPALTAVLKARKGDANIAKTSVALPHSEFLAQEHIVTICTRKRFAVDKCPKGSIYGKAKAWSPLLAKPLEGPVYLRSSDHPLPDMVVALGGELDVNLVGRIDTDKAGGIRATFDAVPDAPVTKFVLKMNGGKKSLLTNSTDICDRKHRATVKMTAQNGRRLDSRPVIGVRCGKGKR